MASSTQPSAEDLVSVQDQLCAMAGQFVTLAGLGSHSDPAVQRSLAICMTDAAKRELIRRGAIQPDHPPMIWEGGLELTSISKQFIQNIEIWPPTTMDRNGPEYQQYSQEFMRLFRPMVERCDFAEQILGRLRSSGVDTAGARYKRAQDEYTESRNQLKAFLDTNKQNALAWAALSDQEHSSNQEQQSQDEAAALTSSAAGAASSTTPANPTKPASLTKPAATTNSASSTEPTPDTAPDAPSAQQNQEIQQQPGQGQQLPLRVPDGFVISHRGSAFINGFNIVPPRTFVPGTPAHNNYMRSSRNALTRLVRMEEYAARQINLLIDQKSQLEETESAIPPLLTTAMDTLRAELDRAQNGIDRMRTANDDNAINAPQQNASQTPTSTPQQQQQQQTFQVPDDLVTDPVVSGHIARLKVYAPLTIPLGTLQYDNHVREVKDALTRLARRDQHAVGIFNRLKAQIAQLEDAGHAVPQHSINERDAAHNHFVNAKDEAAQIIAENNKNRQARSNGLQHGTPQISRTRQQQQQTPPIKPVVSVAQSSDSEEGDNAENGPGSAPSPSDGSVQNAEDAKESEDEEDLVPPCTRVYNAYSYSNAQ